MANTLCRTDERRLHRNGGMQLLASEDQPEATRSMERIHSSAQLPLRHETNHCITSEDSPPNVPDFPFSDEQMRQIHIDSIRADLQASHSSYAEEDYVNGGETEVKGLFFSTKLYGKFAGMVELAADLLKQQQKIDLIAYDHPGFFVAAKFGSGGKSSVWFIAF